MSGGVGRRFQEVVGYFGPSFFVLSFHLFFSCASVSNVCAMSFLLYCWIFIMSSLICFFYFCVLFSVFSSTIVFLDFVVVLLFTLFSHLILIFVAVVLPKTLPMFVTIFSLPFCFNISPGNITYFF